MSSYALYYVALAATSSALDIALMPSYPGTGGTVGRRRRLLRLAASTFRPGPMRHVVGDFGTELLRHSEIADRDPQQ